MESISLLIASTGIAINIYFKLLIENGDKEKLSAEMKKINGIKEILNGIK